jgi:hypothetical protein
MAVTAQVTPSQQLSEVIVTGNKNTFKTKNGKIIYNLSGSVTASGADVLQAVIQIPGVKFSNNEISIVGKAWSG